MSVSSGFLQNDTIAGELFSDGIPDEFRFIRIFFDNPERQARV